MNKHIAYTPDFNRSCSKKQNQIFSQLYYTMLTIKISYRGKNILLPKGLDSLQKIQDQVKSRFPGDFYDGVVAIKYKGTSITDYAQIESISNQIGSKTIKFQVEKEMRKAEEQVEEVKIAEVLAVNSTEVKQEKIQKEQKIIESAEQRIDIQVVEKKISLLDLIDDVDQKLQNQEVSDLKQDIEETKLEQENKIAQVIEERKGNSQILSEKSRDEEVLNVPQFDPFTFIRKEEVDAKQQQPEEKVQQKKGEEREVEREEEKQKQKQKQNQNDNQPNGTENVQNGKVQVEEIIVEPQIIRSKLSFQNGLPEQLQQISPGVYSCFFCRAFENCNVCDTKRKIDSNSKIIVLINKIVEYKVKAFSEELENSLWSRFEERIKGLEERRQKKQLMIKKIDNLQLIKKEQEQDLKKEKESIKSMFFEFDDASENRKEVNVGEEIYWTIKFKCEKVHISKQKVFLIEQRSAELVSINIQNSFSVTFGPFKAEKEGRFEKTYRLCLSDRPGEHQIFGPKIGFVVIVKKEDQRRKMLTNEFRKCLEEIKKGYKISKSTQYIVEKLKQMNINQQNFNDSKQFMPDILTQIQKSK